jgi:outer membrane lipoprotein-sorting protein
VKNKILLLQRAIITLVIFLIIYPLVFSQTIGYDDKRLNILLVNMEKAYKETNTLKVEYIQTMFFESTKEKHETAGTIFLRKPDSIYINQNAPQKQHIYINRKNMMIYTPSNKQVIIEKLKDMIDIDFALLIILSFRNNWKEIKKTNILSLIGEDGEYIIMQVNTIKDKERNIKIYVSKATMYPGRIILESDGIMIEIIFKICLFNSVLDRKIFKLNLPNDIEIIKLN